jgi:hypothetical protein
VPNIYIQLPSRSFPFSEDDFISVLNNTHRIRQQIDGLSKRLMWLIAEDKKTRYFPASYYLSAYGLSHILDRHYFKIERYPDKAKFTIPVVDIVKYIRMAFVIQPQETTRKGELRILDAGKIIGVSATGIPCQNITIITDVNGYIRTAYPS